MTRVKSFFFTLILSLIYYVPMAQKKTTFLALGDSYTIGESVEEAQRWPVQLVKKLNQEGSNIERPHIVAKTGWTTDELLGGLDTATIARSYDLVSLLIGVNNQYRGYDFEQYEKEFNSLLEQALALAKNDPGKVFVVSIPDYGVTPFASEKDPAKIAEELDSYNAYAAKVCQEKDIKYFNITSISRQAVNERNLIASDDLHPSGKMYERWVELMIPWFRKEWSK